MLKSEGCGIVSSNCVTHYAVNEKHYARYLTVAAKHCKTMCLCVANHLSLFL